MSQKLHWQFKFPLFLVIAAIYLDHKLLRGLTNIRSQMLSWKLTSQVTSI